MTDVASTLAWGVIIGMGVANFLLRFTPMALVSRLDLPRPVKRWLSFVPAAVMGSLVFSEVLRPAGQSPPILTSPHVWAAVLTALVFKLTRSFLGATLAGIIAFVALDAVL